MFEKEGRERQFFAEFYKICQKYWVPEDNDDYWKAAIEATDKLSDEYGDIHPAVNEMIIGFMTGLSKSAWNMKHEGVPYGKHLDESYQR